MSQSGWGDGEGRGEEQRRAITPEFEGEDVRRPVEAQKEGRQGDGKW